MFSTKIITENHSFKQEFKRCCEQYDRLQMYVAWVGNPGNLVPFEYLKKISKINIVVGVSFCQSNPDGLKFLLDIDPNMRIAKDDKLFHPKVYVFSTIKRSAIFIGSSNFTYNGFCENSESNVLIEGTQIEVQAIVDENQFSIWRSDSYSFVPDENWFIDYNKRYQIRKNKLREIKIKDEVTIEDRNIDNSSWLAKSEWDIYIKLVKAKINGKFDMKNDDINKKINMLNECREVLKLPWRINYFDDIKNRRIMNGIGAYGWLGHIGASGKVQKLFANGSLADKTTIIKAINNIGKLENPVNWKTLENELKKLEALGHTMNVWGRLLAIVRPDLFCTVSSNSVRKKLAGLLGISQSKFKKLQGYIQLQELIHLSSWYNSPAPKNNVEKEIWLKRAAFLDVVLHN